MHFFNFSPHFFCLNVGSSQENWPELMSSDVPENNTRTALNCPCRDNLVLSSLDGISE